MNRKFSSLLLVGFSMLILTMLLILPTLRAIPVGPLVPVAATAAPQERPDIAYDTLGDRYLVVYSEGAGGGSEIMGRLHRADGTPIGAPFNISNHPGFSDTQPAVAYKAATREYLVVWRYGVPAGTHDIYARRLKNDGSFASGLIAVVATPADEAEPDVAADPLNAGRFVVVWWEIGSASNRGRRLFNNGVLDGGVFVLFTSVRTGPCVAYGSSATADYYMIATLNVNGLIYARTWRPALPPDPQMTVNTVTAAVGPGFGPTLAFHQTFGRWVVLWVGQGANQIRGRYLDLMAAFATPEMMFVPPGGSIRTADVAAGFSNVNQPRFNVSFERVGEIFEVPLGAGGVVGPVSPLFMDGLNNDLRPSIAFATSRREFMSVWQHNAPAGDIYGQCHEIP
jgi:hypothetical protein